MVGKAWDVEKRAGSSRPGPASTGVEELFFGACTGRLAETPRGSGGFGYDPLFIPEGYHQSFGELPEPVKNRLSHRAQALAKLKLRFDPTGARAGAR